MTTAAVGVAAVGVAVEEMVRARQSIDAVIAVMARVRVWLPAVPSGELGALMMEVDRAAALFGAARVGLAADAEDRGDIAASQCASTSAWVAEHSVSLHAGEAHTVAKCAGLTRRRDLQGLPAAIRAADVSPGLAVGVARHFDSIADLLLPGAQAAIMEGFIAAAGQGGHAAVRDLRDHLLAVYGQDEAFDERQQSRAKLLHLSSGRHLEGTVHYELVLDAESSTVVEAAIEQLSAPRPDPGTAEPDLRPAGRRRAEALVQVCRRATAAASVPAGVKAQLLVTMTIQDLQAHTGAGGIGGTGGTGAGAVVGSRAAGTLLAPGTVRKLACDAGIVPIVLGGDSEVLDVGRMHRLFQPGQLKALWLRDRHCTFPDCRTPAHWTDAHHLIHWIDGGETNLDNAALPCARHHTIAHRDRLAGQNVDGHIMWDRRPNSYPARR